MVNEEMAAKSSSKNERSGELRQRIQAWEEEKAFIRALEARQSQGACRWTREELYQRPSEPHRKGGDV